MFDKLSCYPGQPEEEVTQFVIFQSIFAIMPFLLAELLLGIVGLGAIYFGSSGHTVPNVSLPAGVYASIGLLIIIVSLFFFLASIWVWRHNRMVVTNEHVVDVDQLGLFTNKIATLSLGVIQDVSSSISGPAQTFFKYGTLIIQTAGERENFTFTYTPRPHEVEQRILDIHEKFIKKNGSRRDDGLATASVPKKETSDEPLHNPLEDA